MKYYFLILSILLFSNCKSQEVTFSNEEPSKNDLITIATTIGKEKNLITFTEHFNNDIISVSTDNKIYCWGSNAKRNILNNPTTSYLRPVEIVLPK